MKKFLNEVKKKAVAFWQEEDGVAVVEIILILVILIALVLIFKTQMTDLVNDIFEKITTEAGKV